MFVLVLNWHVMPQCWFIELVNISEPTLVSTGVKASFLHNQMWAFANECHKYTNYPEGVFFFFLNCSSDCGNIYLAHQI